MKTFRAALACLPLLVACGDDGTSAEDYAGTWLITSLTTPAEVGTTTLTRDGSPRSVRGDIVITPTADTEATMHVRMIPLVDGVPVEGPLSQTMALAIEDDAWILTEDNGAVTVFMAMRHDDGALMLTADLTDPRTTAEDPPLEVMAMPAPAWTTASVGTWDLLWLVNASGTMLANECTEVVPGQRWAKAQMMLSFDEHLVYQRTMTMAGYGDATCTRLVSMEQSRATGLAEEEGGTTLRMWGIDEGAEVGEALTFTLAGEEHVLTLTRTACAPMPGCLEGAPSTVIVNGR